jgi:hypothetical protein
MLKSLIFDSNFCHSGNALNDPSAVGELVVQIETKCIEVGCVMRERKLFKGEERINWIRLKKINWIRLKINLGFKF